MGEKLLERFVAAKTHKVRNLTETLFVDSTNIIEADFDHVSKHTQRIFKRADAASCNVMPDNRHFFYFEPPFFCNKQKLNIKSGN